jgi:DNA-binding MarR family transcriptional regulator
MYAAVMTNVHRETSKLQKPSMMSGSVRNEGPEFIFRIIRVIRSVEQQHDLHELDPLARELLSLIAERETEGAPTRPSELVQCARLGTPPTIYSRVARLEECGWIIRAQDDQDARSVRIFLSARGRAAFQAMSAELNRRLSHG